MGEPARDAHHFHHVLDPLLAEAIGVGGLIRQCQLVIKGIEMADRGVHILRFNRVAANAMDAVEMLAQLAVLAPENFAKVVAQASGK